MARFFRVTTLFFFVTSLGVEWPPFERRQQGHLDHYIPIRNWSVRTWDRAWRSVCDRRSVFFQQRTVRAKCELKMFKDNVWPKWSEDVGMNCIQHYPLSLSCLSQWKCQNVLAWRWFLKVKLFNQTPRPFKSKPPNSRSSTKSRWMFLYWVWPHSQDAIVANGSINKEDPWS